MTTSHLGWLVLHCEFYCVNGSVVDVHELASVVMAVNDIWDQAHIRFSMGVGEIIDPVPHWPSPYSADPRPAMDQVSINLAAYQRTHPSPTPFNIQGFCGPWTDGTNGRSYPDLAWDIPFFTFFVRDHRVVQPDGSESPPLARVVAHELGHIVGLDHYPMPATNLMGQGAMGTVLTTNEITRARAHVDVILKSAGILTRGTPVTIMSGQYIGSSGNIDIHVWAETDDFPAETSFGYRVTMADGTVVTVRADQVSRLSV